MSVSIQYKQDLVNDLIERLENLGLHDDAEKFDAYVEGFWNDEVSLDEAIREMREIIAQERKMK